MPGAANRPFAKNVDARGVELFPEKVQKAIARGVSVYQGNMEECVSDYPDHAFDYIILSQTLQATLSGVPLGEFRENDQTISIVLREPEGLKTVGRARAVALWAAVSGAGVASAAVDRETSSTPPSPAGRSPR